MTESRLQRWARMKAETQQEVQTQPQAPAQEVDTAPETDPVEQELAINEQLAEREILAKYNLPDPDALEQGTDIKGFLRQEIPEFLRRKALRALWRSNPIFGVLDRLNEYDEDYSKAFIPEGGVKTAYKVGKGGFLDLEKRERERQERALEAETSQDTVRLSEPEQPQDPEESVTDEEQQAPEAVEVTAESEQSEAPPHNKGGGVEAEPENPAPRFRPRMQFESQ
ncbi:DUF3306 domain-containing protein [Marinobacter confluentis]|uniref:DUF3306 domain-containing protein n=1 Tax=Marinobacter confluentis TaxID=1697557 RepID=A0A4Z1CG03_9GAMM|nr:DUF3306 domain-containing protein [Marinobacter confluentis]TGN39164.1 DUF3306 domain-containing protein [Marinobacter confluentis]